MQLTTPVELPKQIPSISHDESILLLGSCLAEHIGNYLINGNFQVNINPFGILYIPQSVPTALGEILPCKFYTVTDLFSFNE